MKATCTGRCYPGCVWAPATCQQSSSPSFNCREGTSTPSATWAEVWPTDAAVTQVLCTSLDASLSTDREVTMSQLNVTLGAEFAGVEEYDSRVTAPAALACLVIGLFGSSFVVP